jgi:hypothetical protein
MLLLPPLQTTATTNPAVIVVAIIAGVIAFFLFRLVFRSLNFIFHLGCLVIVAGVVFLLLRGVIK